MLDIILESIRAGVLLVLVGFLWKLGRHKNFLSCSGWNQILLGFSLLLFGTLLDITDNFDSLNNLVVIGDTEAEAFLEKFVGYLGGYVLLTLGLIRWAPSVEELTNEVAKRKRVTRELAQSQQRFRDISEAGADWVWEVGPDLRYIFISEKIYELLGISAQDIIGTKRGELPGHPKAQRERWNQHYDELDKHLPFRDFSYEFQTPDGRLLILNASGKPTFNPKGKFSGYRGVGSDVTHRVEAEKKLEEARKMAETASRGKSEFLANMGHELKTPLNHIIGYSEMLVDDMGEMEAGEVVKDLGKIHTSGKHLLQLVEALLEIAKIEAGRIEANFELCAIPPLLEETATRLAALNAQRENTLSLRCSDGANDMHTDAVLLRRILYNLGHNAAKFTEQGQLALEVEREQRKSGEWMIFRVQDTGIGMAPAITEGLTKPFTQGDSSPTRKFDGIGLGLALSQRYSCLLGGTLEFESEVGKGTMAILALPNHKLETIT